MRLIFICMFAVCVLILFPNMSIAQEGGTSTEASAFARRAGQALNPDTGVNFLGLYQKSNLGNDPTSPNPNGLFFQEAELQFSADVDPYFRAVALFSIGEVESAHDHEFGLEPEEIFLETLSLPLVTLRLGKFKTAMGRHNILHTHAFPFIDAPLVNAALLGEEGLNDLGISASVLLPTPWFAEFTLQGLNGRAEPLFESPNPNHLAAVSQLKNLWDLTDDATIELNVFGTVGNNAYASSSFVYGSDLTFKWRPSMGGKYHSLSWTTEYLQTLIGGNVVSNAPAFGDRLGGLASWVQYQFAERWWAQARAEALGLPRATTVDPTLKQSFLVGFFPSEFSGFRLQYDHLKEAGQSDEHAVVLQWNISIGAHPAHTY